MTLKLVRGPVRRRAKVRVTNGNAFEVTGRLGGRSVARLGGRRAKFRSKRFALAAKSGNVPLILPRAMRRRLANAGVLRLTLSATVGDPAKHTRRVSKRVTARTKR